MSVNCFLIQRLVRLLDGDVVKENINVLSRIREEAKREDSLFTISKDIH